MEELLKCIKLANGAGKTVRTLTAATKIVTVAFAALVALHMVRGIIDLKREYF